MISLASSEPPLEIQDATVREMWDIALGWKFEVFANFLDAATLQAIASHELVEEEDAVDEIF